MQFRRPHIGRLALLCFVHGAWFEAEAVEQMIPVVVAQRQIAEQTITTTYAPSLPALRLEWGNQVLLIHFKEQRLAWFGKDPNLLAQRRNDTFAELARRQSAIAKESRRMGSGLPTFKEVAWTQWQLTQLSDQACVRWQLKNQAKQTMSYCARAEPSSKKLLAIGEAIASLPMEVRNLLEASGEVALYAKGLVAVEGVRRGKAMRLQSWSESSAKPQLFQLPPKPAASHYYRDRLMDHMTVPDKP